MAKAHLKHDAKKFKVGDVVRVSRKYSYWKAKEKDRVEGWEFDLMKHFIQEIQENYGKEFVVKGTGKKGVGVIGLTYFQPSCVFTKVRKPVPAIPVVPVEKPDFPIIHEIDAFTKGDKVVISYIPNEGTKIEGFQNQIVPDMWNYLNREGVVLDVGIWGVEVDVKDDNWYPYFWPSCSLKKL